eukprot:CAMPEP_0172895860 /NCGR_PEP_ID=MMETSP1075-20121228/154090_1 /TAXON_ID=2916 /ORGANISM="Ceratium fusus, Strain PA161109" /LENGTH=75 /DNA_ID=CAMNT_0013751157 /DNA_START=89 /DNA_END=316 /DNA_ORIENTATION=+
MASFVPVSYPFKQIGHEGLSRRYSSKAVLSTLSVLRAIEPGGAALVVESNPLRASSNKIGTSPNKNRVQKMPKMT